MSFNPYYIEVEVRIWNGPGELPEAIRVLAGNNHSIKPMDDLDKVAETAVARAKGALTTT